MTDWEVPSKMACNCSYIDKEAEGKEIIIEEHIHKVIREVCEQIEDEWQMFLTGVTNGGETRINGYIIPQQEVTAASVTSNEIVDQDYVDKYRIVANLHSHANMQTFFSATDEIANAFIPINIVTNNKNDWIATIHTELPCGMTGQQEIEVTIEIEDGEDLVIEGIDNIKKGRYMYDYKRKNQKVLYNKGVAPKDLNNHNFVDAEFGELWPYAAFTAG